MDDRGGWNVWGWFFSWGWCELFIILKYSAQCGVCLSYLSIYPTTVQSVITYPISTKLASGTKGHTKEVVATSYTHLPQGVFCLGQMLCEGVLKGLLWSTPTGSKNYYHKLFSHFHPTFFLNSRYSCSTLFNTNKFEMKNLEETRCSWGINCTSAWPYVQKIYIYSLSNRVPETTTTQAVPSLSRARTCVAIRAKKKTTTFKQPHRPFLRSRKQWLDWGIVFIYKCA